MLHDIQVYNLYDITRNVVIYSDVHIQQAQSWLDKEGERHIWIDKDEDDLNEGEEREVRYMKKILRTVVEQIVGVLMFVGVDKNSHNPFQWQDGKIAHDHNRMVLAHDAIKDGCSTVVLKVDGWTDGMGWISGLGEVLI